MYTYMARLLGGAGPPVALLGGAVTTGPPGSYPTAEDDTEPML